jgi:hypothetical protein
MIMKQVKTRGDECIRWIEKYCVYPNGPGRGRYVRLTEVERDELRRIYNNPNGISADASISGLLAAYVALFHVCGPVAPDHAPSPWLDTNHFTVWSATGPELRDVLTHEGERIVCPQLGTRYPADYPAAA